MKTTIFVLALLSSIVAAKSKTTNVCETSDASPYLHHVNEMIDNLKDANKGTNLCNPGPENGCGDTDTGYSGEGGAAFTICGDGMRCSGDPGGMPCAGGGCGGIMARMLAEDFESLRDECQGPDSDGDIRVGGIVRTETDTSDEGGGEYLTELKLFSKPG